MVVEYAHQEIGVVRIILAGEYVDISTGLCILAGETAKCGGSIAK
jgi:hypothetical protein